MQAFPQTTTYQDVKLTERLTAFLKRESGGGGGWGKTDVSKDIFNVLLLLIDLTHN